MMRVKSISRRTGDADNTREARTIPGIKLMPCAMNIGGEERETPGKSLFIRGQERRDILPKNRVIMRKTLEKCAYMYG